MAACVLLLAILAGSGVAEASAWAFRKPVTVPSLSEPSLVELRLDGDVIRDASPSLADLRLRDEAGVDVPYAVRRRERVAAESARESPMLDLVATPQGAVRFVLDTGPGGIVHNRVRLSVRDQARNFRVPVRIETSDDGRAWQLTRESGFIYRIEAEAKTAETSVAYPSSTRRWLRVTVGPNKGRALPLAGAAVVTTAAPEREDERVAASLVARDEESMRRTTRAVIDLRSRRTTDRVELDVAERNFHRVVLIEAGDDRKSWRWVGSGAISAVEAGAIRERMTGVRFPETIARYLRLTIQNLDDLPVAVTAARVFAVKRTLVFDAAPGRTYVLDYGNPSAAAPRGDVARALPQLAGERLPEATLGSVRPVPAPPPTVWAPAQPIAMWATIGMTAVALSALLWRMARGVRAVG